jgi:hypothetical protein
MNLEIRNVRKKGGGRRDHNIQYPIFQVGNEQAFSPQRRREHRGVRLLKWRGALSAQGIHAPGAACHGDGRFPQCGRKFSIAWKNRGKVFHSVEDSTCFFHSVERNLP